ncbi:uncharacterized protein PpBr36_10618 [Pyricularia pennisetigena]|uniref:uncharacterized protein n=1 Tax=Pyricularia pennisetigena TaxID=1578925 RepID=UPI0011509DE3|nr:uncharacterized protein PpBr36_10618 [Pyricularia pennisetigena]TLS21211.1 hypothetical protein PpBr36_10618 [Pyricularia pennisetigena]
MTQQTVTLLAPAGAANIEEKGQKHTQRDHKRGLRLSSNLSAELDNTSLPAKAVPTYFHGHVDETLADEDVIDVQIIEQARRTPNAVAVVFEDNLARATYRELADMVHSACHLLSSAMGDSNAKEISSLRGKRVAVAGDVSIERLAVLIAILSLGASYVPIDLANPLDWNKTILKDCRPSCIAFMTEDGSVWEDASSELLAYMEESVQECTRVRVPAKLRPHETVASSNRAIFPPTPGRSDEDTAYILYTSGSTGVPKGVPIQHKALKNSIIENRRVCLFSAAKTRVLGINPWTFDVSVFDMFGPLSIGAQLILGRRDYILSDLTGVVQQHSITHITTTPTVASLLNPDDVPSIKSLALGGEPMTKATRDTWAPRIRLYNSYGPTEATIIVITRRCHPDTPVANIGRPLANVAAYVLEDSLGDLVETRQLPVGKVGQLALGGVQLSPGYLRNSPGRPNPFVQHREYGQLYLTGDMAMFESDGTIVCLGRMDNMVNLRGLRVELGAVEAAVDEVLVRLTGAGKCVSLKLVKKGTGQEVQVALFCTDNNKSGGRKSIIVGYPLDAKRKEMVCQMKAAVLEKFPDYFLPDYWVPVDGFPRNKNQKLDRKVAQAFVDGLSNMELAAWHLDNYSDVDVKE